MKNKDVRAIAALAPAQGWAVDATASNHPRFTSPDGAVVTTSGTTASASGFLNFKAELKRNGFLFELSSKPMAQQRDEFESWEVRERNTNIPAIKKTLLKVLDDEPQMLTRLSIAVRLKGQPVLLNELEQALAALVEERRVVVRAGGYVLPEWVPEALPVAPVVTPEPVVEAPVELDRASWLSTWMPGFVTLRGGINHLTNDGALTVCGYTIPAEIPARKATGTCAICIGARRATVS